MTEKELQRELNKTVVLTKGHLHDFLSTVLITYLDIDMADEKNEQTIHDLRMYTLEGMYELLNQLDELEYLQQVNYKC
jgi:hypothetical protein